MLDSPTVRAALRSSTYISGGATSGGRGGTTYTYQVDGTGGIAADANAMDYTGQDGASGACAQCYSGDTDYFTHNGTVYLYNGPRPASIGAGCPDTVTDDHFTPLASGTVDWDDVTGKPSTYPPSTHTHPLSQVPSSIIDSRAKVRLNDTWANLSWAHIPDAPSAVTTGDAFPVTPSNGDLHYRTLPPLGLFMWYVDDSSSQWVAV